MWNCNKMLLGSSHIWTMRSDATSEFFYCVIIVLFYFSIFRTLKLQKYGSGRQINSASLSIITLYFMGYIL
jgi:hypothetical protein